MLSIVFSVLLLALKTPEALRLAASAFASVYQTDTIYEYMQGYIVYKEKKCFWIFSQHILMSKSVAYCVREHKKHVISIVI